MTKLNKKYKKAIEMKYDGESYETVAKNLKVALQTVKDWFYKGGILTPHYKEYSELMNETKTEVAKETIIKNLDIAAQMIVGLMGSDKDEIKFKAAKEILDRELGKPKETVEHEGNIGLDFSYEHILKKARQKQKTSGGGND
jgi:transposase